MIIIPILCAAAIMLTQYFDWHSTLAFLKSGHGYETNTMLRKLFAKYGANRVMIVKGLLHAIPAAALFFLPLQFCFATVPFVLVYVPMILKNYRIAAGKV